MTGFYNENIHSTFYVSPLSIFQKWVEPMNITFKFNKELSTISIVILRDKTLLKNNKDNND